MSSRVPDFHFGNRRKLRGWIWLLMLVAACSGCDRARPAPPGPALPVSLSSAAGKAARISIADDAELEPVTGIVFRELKLDDVHYDNGNSAGFDTILETLGGGVAVLDYDRDGWLDLLFPGGGRFSSGADDFTLGAAPRLLRGGGGSSWLPVESSAGLTQSAPYSHGCAAADFDSDGFVDLFITGYRGVLLFRNQGDGTFVECAAPSGIVDSGWSTGAAWGDLDGDGALDLYLVRYVEWSLAAHRVCVAGIATPAEICGPKHFPAADDRIYLSRGDGTFADAGANLGLQPGGKGLSVVLGDVDLDGDLDAYVANDTTENFLYLNDGHGQLREVGVLHGVAYDEDGKATGSMGVALADYDGDGLPDLWTTNFEFEALALYRNLGTGRFHYVSRPAGVAAIGDEFVGWGTAFVDLDRDGDLDVVVSNGHLPKYPRAGNLAQPALLLTNDGRGRFRRARHASGSYFAIPHRGRGLALGDFDRDGKLDIAVSHLFEPATVLMNDTPDGNHALRVALVGRQSNRDAVGALAVLETSTGSQMRQVVGGGSYLSQSELALDWGYPAGTTLKRLVIHWPSGIVQTLDDLVDDTRLLIVEPAANSAQTPAPGPHGPSH